MSLSELNTEINKLETELKSLKMKRLFLTGKRGRIFYAGNSYISRRSVERVLRNAHLWASLRYADTAILQKAAVLRATKGATNDVQKIETFEEWEKVESIYLGFVKEYVKDAERIAKETKS